MKKKPYRKMRAEFYVDGEIWFHVREVTLDRLPVVLMATEDPMWSFSRNQLDVYRGRIVTTGFEEHINA
jgi:hypothetical protein